MPERSSHTQPQAGEQTPRSFPGEELEWSFIWEIKPKPNRLGLIVQTLHLWQLGLGTGQGGELAAGTTWLPGTRKFSGEKKEKQNLGTRSPQTLQGVFLKTPPKSTFSSSQLEFCPFPARFLGSQTPAAPDTPKGQSGFGTMSPWGFFFFSPHLIPSLVCKTS